MTSAQRGFNGLTIGVVLTALSASAFAAESGAPGGNSDTPQVNVVDFMQTGAATAGPIPSGIAQTLFVDLTSGTATATATAQIPPPSATQDTPVTRFVDLASGASPPADGMVNESPEAPMSASSAEDPGDPYEKDNRSRFGTHVALHRHIIDPVETVYVEGVPEPARFGLHNFLTNLESPSVFINDVLQGRIGGAGATLTRFVINSTIGIAGILDVASHIGLRYRDNDFGETLALYGVSDRPYLLVPVIGPSNPRDLAGKVVDFALNPLHLVALPGGIVTSVGHAGAHELDKRSVDVGELDQLSRTVPDPYAVERNTARDRRNREIGIYEAPQ